MRVTPAVSACIAVVLLSACGGADAEPESEPGPTSVAATAEAETATTQQYASLVAKSYPESVAEMEDCNWRGRGPLDWEPGSIVCQLGLMDLYLQAETLQIELSTARDESNKNLIGQPPDEIAQLVADTESAGKGLAKAARRAEGAGCVETGAGRCLGLRGDVTMAMSVMSDQLNAWKPYL